MKKLITFSLWGDNPKYCAGAIDNVRLAQSLFPGWTCRFYVSGGMRLSEVPGRPGILTLDGEFNKTLLHLMRLQAQGELVEIVHMDEPADWKGMFWRFYPAAEEDVEAFISRDCDSRLSEREAQAVQEWIRSPQLIHVMRDHPYHSVPILGGMWGTKQHAIPEMMDLIANWKKEDRWQTDQEFLTAVIWPAYRHKILAHDNWNRFAGCKTIPFPSPRQNNEFVGAIIGANGERLHPEHHQLVSNA